MRCIGLAVLLVASISPAVAEEQLPTELAGTGTAQGRHTVIAPWSISIEAQQPDGTIKGKMSWSGRSCKFKDLPFTGSYRDGVLNISAPETHANCGAWTINMRRTSATEFTFEGTAQTSDLSPPVSVTLAKP